MAGLSPVYVLRLNRRNNSVASTPLPKETSKRLFDACWHRAQFSPFFLLNLGRTLDCTSFGVWVGFAPGLCGAASSYSTLVRLVCRKLAAGSGKTFTMHGGHVHLSLLLSPHLTDRG